MSAATPPPHLGSLGLLRHQLFKRYHRRCGQLGCTPAREGGRGREGREGGKGEGGGREAGEGRGGTEGGVERGRKRGWKDEYLRIEFVPYCLLP